MIRLIIVLTTICIITGSLLGLTYNVTKDKIKLQEENLEMEALKTVLPDAIEFSKKLKGNVIDYYKALDNNGSVMGYAFIGEGKGYSSTIRIMIGVNPEGILQGIKIISQQETPGLGSKVDETKSSGTLWDILKGKHLEKPKGPWFQEQFRNRAPDSVEAITGATITSKAVIDTVKGAVEKFKMYES